MNPETIISELRRINRWRRGEDESEPMPDPKYFGWVMDAAADTIGSLIASNTTLRRERNEANDLHGAARAASAKTLSALSEALDGLARVTAERNEIRAGAEHESRAIASLAAENAALRARVKDCGDAATWVICDPGSVHLSEHSKAMLQVLRDDGTNVFNALRARVAELEKEREQLAIENTRAQGSIARLERDFTTANNAFNLASEQRDKAEQRVAEMERELERVGSELAKLLADEPAAKAARMKEERDQWSERYWKAHGDAHRQFLEWVKAVERNTEQMRTIADFHASNAELVAALRNSRDALNYALGAIAETDPLKRKVEVTRDAASEVLARAESATSQSDPSSSKIRMTESATPAKRPDTELLDAARALVRDAEVFGLAGATNSPSVRCDVKGLTLGHWYALTAAIDAARKHGGPTQ